MAVGAIENLSLGDEVLMSVLCVGGHVFNIFHQGGRVFEDVRDRASFFIFETLPADLERLRSDIQHRDFSRNLRSSALQLWQEVVEMASELMARVEQRDDEPDESIFRGLHI